MKGRLMLLAAFALLFAVPTGAAVKVHAPTHVFGFDATIVVEEIHHEANASLTFDGKLQTKQELDPGDRGVWTFSELKRGIHRWNLTVRQVNAAPVHIDGTIWIEDPSLLVGQLDAMRNTVAEASSNASWAADEVAHLTGNETGLRAFMDELELRIHELDVVLANLDGLNQSQKQAQEALQSLTAATANDLAQVQELQSETTTAARAASTWGIVAVSIGTVGSLMILAAAAILYVNGRARHREAMALLLAFAAKSGVTPDSEELKVALQALGED